MIHTSTYQALTDDELSNPNEVKLQEEFDKAITAKLGAPMSESELSPKTLDAQTPTFDIYEDDETTPLCLPEVGDIACKEADNYVGTEVNLPIGGTLLGSTIKHQAHDINGNLTGTVKINPILDSRTYEVEFLDGRTAEISTNARCEHMVLSD